MPGLRNISGHPRCTPHELDCDDFAYQALWNDMVDNTNLQLGAGSELVYGRTMNAAQNFIAVGAGLNSTVNVTSFELVHGQNRFRLMTRLNVPLYQSTVAIAPIFLNNSSQCGSIIFKAKNISKTAATGIIQEAILLQVFRNRSSWMAVSGYLLANNPTLYNQRVPGFEAPANYYQDFAGLVPGMADIFFESEIPPALYPLPGQSDVIELRVFAYNFNPYIVTTEPLIVNQINLCQILEP